MRHVSLDDCLDQPDAQGMLMFEDVELRMDIERMLTDEERLIVELLFYEELSLREAARILHRRKAVILEMRDLILQKLRERLG